MSGLEITIRQQNANRRILKMASDGPSRVQSIIDHYSMSLAQATLPVLQGLAPKDIPRYAGMMRAVRFRIGDMNAAGVMIPGYARKHGLTERDAQRTVLFIKPKMKGGIAMDPSSVVLWRSNPWTMETLPFEPSRRVATIVSRRVSAREARSVEVSRLAQRPEVERELRALGAPIKRKHPVLLEHRVERDLAFEVMRREFGLGDSPHVAHWRPAVRYAKNVLVKQVLKRYLRWLSAPAEMRWKRPLQGKPGKVSEVRRALAFQKHIRA